MKASDYLRQAAEVIEQRGQLRDTPEGERSMARAVEAYTVLNGAKMESELEGWLFMAVLKLARATAGKPHEDDWTDLAGYAALAAECLSREAAEKERIQNDIDTCSAPNSYTGGPSTDGVWIPYPSRLRSGAVAEQLRRDVMNNNAKAAAEKQEKEWIPWYGGECPVSPQTRVTVRFRSGEENGKKVAGSWWWYWFTGDVRKWDIVAYKVVEDNKEV